jgi:hypothetical protein
MSEVQLRLFSAPQPLVERLGSAFFRGVPQVTGIYRMHDAADRLIYVGKARNLRARLNSYRRTHGQSRKTIRLIHTAARVDWETCVTEAAALVRENELIRTHRPRFNRAGVWPKSARFVIARDDGEGGLRLSLAGEPDAEAQCFGAFRGGVALAFAALGRLVWLAESRFSEPASLPVSLSENLPAHRIEWSAPAGWRTGVVDFWAGSSDEILVNLAAAVPPGESAFAVAWQEAAFEFLQVFWHRTPARHRQLRERFAGGRVLLAGEEWDDYSAMASPEPALVAGELAPLS